MDGGDVNISLCRQQHPAFQILLNRTALCWWKVIPFVLVAFNIHQQYSLFGINFLLDVYHGSLHKCCQATPLCKLTLISISTKMFVVLYDFYLHGNLFVCFWIINNILVAFWSGFFSFVNFMLACIRIWIFSDRSFTMEFLLFLSSNKTEQPIFVCLLICLSVALRLSSFYAWNSSMKRWKL